MASLTINYKRPAPVDTMLEIRTAMGGLERRSGVLHQVMNNQANGKLVADAEVTFAVIDTTTGRAVPLEGELRAVFEGPPEAAAQ